MSKRSIDIDEKPKAKKWIERNKVIAKFFLLAVEDLRSIYKGDNEGYVDFSPPQYRFNDNINGSYISLRVKSDGSIDFKLKLNTDKVINTVVKNNKDFIAIKNYLKKNKFKGFIFNSTSYLDDFDTQVEKSIKSSQKERAKRLAKASPIPKKVSRTIIEFNRNPDVVAQTLLDARGICGRCNKPAPFARKKDGSPYLEVHHIIRLADGGADTLNNAIALCPNCHRKSHYG
ncbi:HNH endonuclease signature motif containing protein [Pseudoalteromonas sp. CAL260-MNA-CIBAN-0059]|uniref:HNH endonuclease n=1 Tax=Pseudoalteromonas sp. CAL260-MNA-CIBAN-0059 TaxID=3140430 RepID=UPI003328D804|tara:strand:- start:543 stop:1232 length:690 start_codon:yes stop_codon:yes gene_type:complete